LAQRRANLSKMRKNRNYDCHILEKNDTIIQASKAQKTWRYVVSNLKPEVRLILDVKCGGKETVDDVVNYLTRQNDYEEEVDQDLVDWFMNW